jgi:hypothetical protein
METPILFAGDAIVVTNPCPITSDSRLTPFSPFDLGFEYIPPKAA